MPRLSELIRRPDIRLGFSHLPNETSYLFASDQLGVVPQLGNYQGEILRLPGAKIRDATRLCDQVAQEYSRLTTMVSSDEVISVKEMRSMAVCLVSGITSL